MKRIKHFGVIGACAVALMAAAPVQAVTYSFSNITANNVNDAATGEAQLSVDVTDAGNNQVLFTFSNAGPNASSITDVYFDDGALLGISTVFNGPGVDFSVNANPGNLPGGNTVSPPFEASSPGSAFTADSDPPAQPNGVNPGETLGILFDLQAGMTYADVISGLNNPITAGMEADPLGLRIGIHVQGFDGGGSEGFINIPVPVPGAALLGAMGLGLVGLRRKRAA